MLKKWEPLEDYLEEESLRAFMRLPLRHLASELMEQMGYHTGHDFEEALTRTFEVCCTMHINIPQHFRRVYVQSDSGLQSDWQLTDLGSYLLMVNGNSRNERVAHAQLYFLRK